MKTQSANGYLVPLHEIQLKYRLLGAIYARKTTISDHLQFSSKQIRQAPPVIDEEGGGGGGDIKSKTKSIANGSVLPYSPIFFGKSEIKKEMMENSAENTEQQQSGEENQKAAAAAVSTPPTVDDDNVSFVDESNEIAYEFRNWKSLPLPVLSALKCLMPDMEKVIKREEQRMKDVADQSQWKNSSRSRDKHLKSSAEKRVYSIYTALNKLPLELTYECRDAILPPDFWELQFATRMVRMWTLEKHFKLDFPNLNARNFSIAMANETRPPPPDEKGNVSHTF
jgi:hypothetical protein